jgi:hypothetical protein
LLSSRSFPHLPTLLPLPKHPNTHTHTQINLRFLSQNTEPALHRSYPQLFPVCTRFSSFQQQLILVFLVSPFHRVPCFFWIGVWFCFFGFRSTRLLPLVQDMTLSNGFLGFSGVRWWSPSSPPPSRCRRVSPTCPRASLLNRRMLHPPASSIFSCFLPRRNLTKLGLPVDERLSLGGAWFSRATQDGSHPSSTRFSAAFVYFRFMIFWAFVLSPFPHVYLCYYGVWVLVTQYTFEITFTGDPDFVASVSRANGPASSEVLPRVLSFLVSILGCPYPLVVLFLFCCNWLLIVLIKKKEKKKN